MVNSLLNSLSKLQISFSKNENYHATLALLIETVETEAVFDKPSKIAIEISFLEEIANLANKISSQDSILYDHIAIIECGVQDFLRHWKGMSSLQCDLKSLQESVHENSKIINSYIRRVGRILNDYRDRCRNSFLDYLKAIDMDLRRLLKPLVPTSVVIDQVKFPLINENQSLRSSVVMSQSESPREDTARQSSKDELDTSASAHPNELTVEKLNTHIGMLVGTLEKVAKDLIQIVAESNRQYFEILNQVDVYSRPPTPLAAPLPEYFCFDTEESEGELKIHRQVFPKNTKGK